MNYSTLKNNNKFYKADNEACSPVICTGRGGSGTRLLSLLIQEIGVFLGNDFNESEDSLEWVDLIYSLSLKVLTNQALKHLQDEKTKFQNNAEEVLGSQSLSNWGWKLPESILIIPQLHEIFPEAKFIHLTRHPVGCCLRRSHVTSRMSNPIGKAVLENAYSRYGRDIAHLDSDETWLRNAYSYKYQLENIVDYSRRHLNENNFLEIKFEDLVEIPRKISGQIAEFLDIDLVEDKLLKNIESNRIGEWSTDDKKARQIWSLCKDVAVEMKYKF